MMIAMETLAYMLAVCPHALVLVIWSTFSADMGGKSPSFVLSDVIRIVHFQ
jgi:hypothetical protein